MPDSVQERAEQMLNALWQKHQPLLHERMEILQRAKRALLDGALDEQLRTTCAGEAHKLAGALGTFGLERGTDAARELERWMNNAVVQDATETARIANLIDELAEILDRGRTSASPHKLAAT